jgi:hypothetical protein
MIIMFPFTREEVAAQSFGRFFSDFGPDKLSKDSELKNYLGKFVFFIDGYNNDPRELFVIPEVRSFFRAFNSQWPFWFFACNMDVPNLQTMVFSCLPSIQLTPGKPDELYRVDFRLPGMVEFLNQEFGRMESLCHRAGMSPEEIGRRRQEILDFFRKDWTALMKGQIR